MGTKYTGFLIKSNTFKTVTKARKFKRYFTVSDINNRIIKATLVTLKYTSN